MAARIRAARDAPSALARARAGFEFTGTVNWVRLDLGDDSHDHLITPEDRLRAAMVRQ